MTCIVQKYGGSSVADLERLQQIAMRIAEVKRAGMDVAVVVSAMGKTTDRLVDMARELCPTPPRREMDMLLSTGERITHGPSEHGAQQDGARSRLPDRISGRDHHQRPPQRRAGHRGSPLSSTGRAPEAAS